MKRFEGMILCSDVDGTLIDEQNKVPKENIEAIAYFQSQGGKFMLATGRIPEAVIPVLDNIRLDFPCICHNGCSIYDFNKKEYIATTALSKSAEAPTREIMKLFPESGVEIMTNEGIYVLKQTFATDRHISFEKVTSKNAPSFEAISATWLKILFAQTSEDTTKMQKAMEHSPFQKDFNMLRTHQYYYEIYHKSASKGNGIRQLFSLYHINPEYFYAIGDNDNDLEMLSMAGTSAAVANAAPSVKQAATRIMTRSNQEGGVAEFIATL